MMTTDELKAKRGPVLEKRELNRKAKTPSIKVEKDCNDELVKLNLAIKGAKPYAVKKKASKKKADPLS
jgi:hypothetical protein